MSLRDEIFSNNETMSEPVSPVSTGPLFVERDPVIVDDRIVDDGGALDSFHTTNPEDREPNNTGKILGALAVALMVGAAGIYAYQVSGHSVNTRSTVVASAPQPAPMQTAAATPPAPAPAPVAQDNTPAAAPTDATPAPAPVVTRRLRSPPAVMWRPPRPAWASRKPPATAPPPPRLTPSSRPLP